MILTYSKVPITIEKNNQKRRNTIETMEKSKDKFKQLNLAYATSSASNNALYLIYALLQQIYSKN